MSLSSGTELQILKGRTYPLLYLAVDDSEQHLSGPGFDSQLGANFRAWVEKIPLLCLARSQVTTPVHRSPTRELLEWVVADGPLVIGG
jgi:hypothetical protein